MCTRCSECAHLECAAFRREVSSAPTSHIPSTRLHAGNREAPLAFRAPTPAPVGPRVRVVYDDEDKLAVRRGDHDALLKRAAARCHMAGLDIWKCAHKYVAIDVDEDGYGK